MLSANKVKSIDALSNPRKYELQFLSAILHQLELSQNNQNQLSEQIFYGAVFIILQDIENHRKFAESAGLLHARLKVSMNLKENKFNLYQMARFYTSLNLFLSQIFVQNDSRQGFARQHMLHELPMEKLKTLVNISYKLEQKAQKAIVASLLKDGESTAHLPHYLNQKNYRPTPPLVTRPFESWVLFVRKFNTVINTELGDKNKAEISALKQPRRAQLLFLVTIIQSLDKSEIDESEKVAILAGAMHLIRQQIIYEYLPKTSSYFSTLRPSILTVDLNRSIVFKHFSEHLDAEHASPEDVESLIYSATQFVRFMTVESNTTDNPKETHKKIRSTHIFSSIQDFNLQDTFKLFIDMIQACREQALQHNIDAFNTQHAPAKKTNPSYLSSWFGKKEEDNSSEEEEDLVLDRSTFEKLSL